MSDLILKISVFSSRQDKSQEDCEMAFLPGTLFFAKRYVNIYRLFQFSFAVFKTLPISKFHQNLGKWAIFRARFEVAIVIR